MGEKLYLQLVVKRGRGPAQPVLATDDPDLIAGFGRLVAAKTGVELSAMVRMVPPPEKRPESEEG